MQVEKNEREILRQLAARVAEIAAEPKQAALRKHWTEHNDLGNRSPLVMCFPEGAWLELVPSTSLKCEDPILRSWETRLRMAIYTHDVIGDDQVIDAVFNVPWDMGTTDFGLSVGQSVPEGERSVYYIHPYSNLSLVSNPNLGAYHIEPALTDRSDFPKLSNRRLVVNRERSEEWLEAAHEVFDEVLEVRRRVSTWLLVGGVAPDAARLRGIQNLMLDMFDAPEWVHEFVKFLADDHNALLDELEAGGYLTENNGCEWIGTGGIGYCSELPGAEFDPTKVKLSNVWGGTESQDLVGISADMFAEFFLPYMRPFCERFGLVHYGCCEPVHGWFPHLRTISNLRRVSVSPWADAAKCAEQMKGDYVFSYKPNPTTVCTGAMNEDDILASLTDVFSITKEHGCVPEVILKDLHTLRGEPDRIPRWVSTARRAIEKVY